MSLISASVSPLARFFLLGLRLLLESGLRARIGRGESQRRSGEEAIGIELRRHEGFPAARQRRGDARLHPRAEPRAVHAARAQVPPREFILLAESDQRHVGVGARAQRAPLRPHHRRRARRHLLDQKLQRPAPRRDEFRVEKRKRRLHADDAERRRVEDVFLRVRRMRRVVRRNAVERAINQRGDQRVAVLRLAERRLHLGVGVVADHRFLGHREVVGADLRRDVDAVAARLADRLDALARGDVADVNVSAGRRGKRGIAREV